MRRLSDVWFRIRALLGGSRMDREFTEEAAFHLEMETRELIRGGMDPTEARRQAKLAFGGVEAHREKARDARGIRPLEDLIQDVRYGVRTLRRSPLFSGVILIVLTLGIGASTAIFSVVDGILFRSLPYPDADRIVRVFGTGLEEEPDNVSGADYLDIDAQSEVFETLAGYNVMNFNLVQEAGPQRLRGASVTSDYFQVFRVDALLGRTLSPDIEGPGRASTVVLSHGFWQAAFGGDAEVLGQPIELNDQAYQIVGIMPPDFDYPGVSLWTSARFSVPDQPFAGEEDPGLDRGAEYVDMVGRLRGSVSLEEAGAEMEVISARLTDEYPDTNEGDGLLVIPLQESLTESVRPTLRVLLGAVGVLLLIACGNVANLLLARASGREQEMALRQALGASRRRIVSQMLTESTLLAGAGGILGALLAVWLTSGLLSLAPEGIPRVSEVGVDLRFVAFAVLLSLAAGLVTGILPSLRAAGRGRTEGALFSGARQAGSHRRSGARRALVIGEVAFSLILVVGAGLMVRTLMVLNKVDPGFQPDRTVAAHLSLPEISYPTDGEISDFVRRVEETVRARPGVQSAGMVLSLPIRAGISGTFFFSVEGRIWDEGDDPRSGLQIATPGYFGTLGIPLLEGRLFTEVEEADDPRVVVINEAAAERFFPDGGAVGQRVTLDDPEEEDVEWATIVGIVGNSLQGGLDKDPRPEIFHPYSQYALSYMTLVVRGESGSGSLAGILRESVMEVDPRVPLHGMATMEELLSESLGQRRFAMSLLITFAAVALLLAAIGLYGVLRYGVTQRSKEIGIRVALGASTRGIVRQVMSEGLALTLLGLAAGVGLALPAGRLMSSLVFQVGTSDPATYVISGILLTAVALVACGPPALRAARTDPLEALREE